MDGENNVIFTTDEQTASSAASAFAILPAGVQVLIHWFALLLSTILTYLHWDETHPEG